MEEKDFSAFVFKIQANMNKAHQRQDCIYADLFRSSLRQEWKSTMCREEKKIRLSQPQQMMAQ